MTPPKARSLWIGLLLVIATFLTFAPALTFDFVNFDDPKYVTENTAIQHGLTSSGLHWAFTSKHASNWHPLTWISHMLDVEWFGMQAGKHHLTNVLFHCANTFLLFWLLQGITGAVGRSAFVAALFALHPLHVESVAWISERKDVLSAFFFMLTLWAYCRFAASVSLAAPQKPGIPRPVFYSLSLSFFALGLMSKPMLVTLPFVLILLDFWPLKRLSLSGRGIELPLFWRVMAEKLPFFALSAASCFVTLRAQTAGGAVASLTLVPLHDRVLNAITGYLAYVDKTFWPRDLAVLYLPRHEWAPEQVLLAVLFLLVVTAGVLIRARQEPYLLCGWFWFVGMLVPVIGLVQAGDQWIADRYTYLPLIGLFVGVTWAAAERLRQWHFGPVLQASIAILILAATGLSTRRQLKYWTGSEALFTRCVEVQPDNFVAHNNLANALVRNGKYKAAQAHYEQALQIQPAYANAMQNLGVLLTQQGQIDAALDYLRQAAAHGSDLSRVFGKLGLALEAQGKIVEAVTYYREALRLQPDQLEPCNNLAWILATSSDASLRNGPEAVEYAERACRLSHYQLTVALGTLAAAYAEAGRYSNAVMTAEQAITLAKARGENDLAQKNESLLQIYRAGQPYHEGTLPKP